MVKIASRLTKVLSPFLFHRKLYNFLLQRSSIKESVLQVACVQLKKSIKVLALRNDSKRLSQLAYCCIYILGKN